MPMAMLLQVFGAKFQKALEEIIISPMPSGLYCLALFQEELFEDLLLGW